MRLLALTLLGLIVAGCSLSLTEAEQKWCDEGHVGSMLLAAEQLGVADEVVDARERGRAIVEAEGEAAALRAFYSLPTVIASCRRAFELDQAGTPLMPAGEEP